MIRRNHLGRPLPALSMARAATSRSLIACGATHVRIGTAIFGASGVMVVRSRNTRSEDYLQRGASLPKLVRTLF